MFYELWGKYYYEPLKENFLEIPQKRKHFPIISLRVHVIGKSMPRPGHCQKFLRPSRPLIQLAGHERGNEIIRLPVNEQNGQTAFRHLRERGRFSQIVAAPKLENQIRLVQDGKRAHPVPVL